MLGLLLSVALLAPQGEVSAEASLSADEVPAGGRVELRIQLRIADGWHVYHPDQDPSSGIPVSVEMTGEGITAGELSVDQAPGRHLLEVAGQRYEYLWLQGEPTFTLPVTVSGPPRSAEIEAAITWQVCDDAVCLPPETKTFTLPLTVVAGDGAGGGAATAASATSAAQREPPRWEVEDPSGYVEVDFDAPQDLQPGETRTLEFTLKVAEGWHVYHPDISATLGKSPWVEVEGEGYAVGEVTTDAEPHVELLAGEPVPWLQGEVTFSFPLTVTGDATPPARLHLGWQVCDDSICLPDEVRSFPIGGTAGGAAGSSGGGLPEGLLAFLLTAAAAGAFTLLTPCVFPMIPVTISYFTKRSEGGKGSALGNALAYAGGIVLTFAGVGVAAALILGPTGANQIGANPWVNIAIGLLFVGMALSLIGFYEIRPPKFLQRFASKAQSEGHAKRGYLPVVLMAVAFSITAFTCTVAFVGFVFAMGLRLGVGYLVGGMFVYGLVFALPFFFLAMFPSYLRRLPQAGGWMNAVKVSAGFVELIAAVKFFSNTDLGWKAGVLTWPVYLGVTLLFIVLWGAYLLGLYRAPCDHEKPRPGKPRLAVGLLVLLLGVHLAPGLWNRPYGGYASIVYAYMPPPDYGMEEGAEATLAAKPGGLSWTEDYGEAYALAQERGEPLFVDFTGVTCVNCRQMEQDVFPDELVLPLLRQFTRAELWVDRAPFGPWNADFEVERFGAAAQPYYVVIDPRDDAELAVSRGYDPDPAKFAAFLAGALEEYRTRTPGDMPPGGPWHERHPVTRIAEMHVPAWVTRLSQGILVALLVWLTGALLRQELRRRGGEARPAEAS